MRSDILWNHTAGAGVGVPELNGDISTDVLVIGGGYTGCSTALRLAGSGTAVCLLEARTVGYGGSGRNVGLVNPGLWLEPDRVEKSLGRAAGTRLNEALAVGPERVFSLIEQHGIECDVSRNGTLHCAHSGGGLAQLTERLRQYRARDWDVELLDVHETARKTGTTAYCGALWDHRAGTVQPLAYVRGLADAAIRSGAKLFEMSPVTSLEYRSGRWTAATATGSVSAEAVVLATNAYHAGFGLDATPRFTPLNFFQMATRPMDPGFTDSILPQRQGVWDTLPAMSAFRVDADRRLILGAVGSLDGFGRGIHRSWARRRIRVLYPELAHLEFEHAWTGRIAMTSDHVPRIVKFGGRALSVYGYSGRGIASGTVFGLSVADYLVSGDEKDLPIEPVGAHREVFPVVKQIGYELGATGFHFATARGGS